MVSEHLREEKRKIECNEMCSLHKDGGKACDTLANA